MKILKFFLYIVCFISIFWCCLFFAGPSVIKKAIGAYSGSQISAFHIEVRPNLNIKIGRLEFDFFEAGDGPKIVGSSRAIDLVWSINKGRPLVDILVGPTVFENVATLDSMRVSIPSLSVIDFKAIPIKVQAKSVHSKKFFSSDQLILQGVFSRNAYTLSNTSFDLSDLVFKGIDAPRVEIIHGKISNLLLNKSIADQELEVEIIAENIDSFQSFVTAEVIDVNLTKDVSKIHFRLNSKEMLLQKVKGKLEDLQVTGSIEDFGENLSASMDIELEKADFLENKLIIDNLSASARLPFMEDINIKANGLLNKFELLVNSQYLGQLPKGRFELGLEAKESLDQVVSFGVFDFKSDTIPRIKLNSEFTVNLENVQNALSCFANACTASKLDFAHEILIDDERIGGKSICASTHCTAKDLSHNFKTSNTLKIFDNLASSNLFNPFTLAYLYSAFLSGKPIGKGHQVKF